MPAAHDLEAARAVIAVIAWNACMMPTTVPNRPTYGASEPIVPTIQSAAPQLHHRLVPRRVEHLRSRSSSAMFRQRRPSRKTSAIGVFDASQSVRAAATSRAHQALDQLPGEVARVAVEAAVAPQALERDREHEHRERGQRIGGEPALCGTFRAANRCPSGVPFEIRPRNLTGRTAPIDTPAQLS